MLINQAFYRAQRRLDNRKVVKNNDDRYFFSFTSFHFVIYLLILLFKCRLRCLAKHLAIIIVLCKTTKIFSTNGRIIQYSVRKIVSN
ncbi:hypothetical protein ANTPLA_LOCUS9961 [Anthophora plagiata]